MSKIYQIEELMIEAGEHGDLELVDLCRQALDGDEGALAACAEAIEAATAMDDCADDE